MEISVQQIIISEEEIESRIRTKVKHFAYPYWGKRILGKERGCRRTNVGLPATVRVTEGKGVQKLSHIV